MCLCLFAINQHDEYPLILLANRDEFRKRPAAKAAFWEDNSNILAGRDLEGMGTWLGVNTAGNIAFLTNYRHPDYFNRKGPTRGKLVSDFLSGNVNANDYLSSIEKPEDYNGFNLVTGSFEELYYFSNIENEVRKIETGIHGLSNAFLNTSWPKVVKGKTQLGNALVTNQFDNDSLFDILKDEERPSSGLLPDTGVGDELERMLSPKFINSEEYGTVCSTVVRMKRNGEVTFEERSFDKTGKSTGNAKFDFEIKKDPNTN